MSTKQSVVCLCFKFLRVAPAEQNDMKFISRLLKPLTFVLLIVLVAGCAIVTHSSPGTTTTVILTRHADRDPMATELNDQGRLRAQALVEAVAEMNITAIYSPDLKRNLDTARPLAEHLGIEVQIIGASKYEVSKTILTKHPGEVVIGIGKSGNLKEIYPFLGGEGAPPTVYGDLFIMKIRDSGSPEVIKKRYGPA